MIDTMVIELAKKIEEHQKNLNNQITETSIQSQIRKYNEHGEDYVSKDVFKNNESILSGEAEYTMVINAMAARKSQEEIQQQIMTMLEFIHQLKQMVVFSDKQNLNAEKQNQQDNSDQDSIMNKN